MILQGFSYLIEICHTIKGKEFWGTDDRPTIALCYFYYYPENTGFLGGRGDLIVDNGYPEPGLFLSPS
jgi:hypothetical protein